MKKITFLALLVFSLGVFAASVDLGAKGSIYVNPQTNESKLFNIGQTDVTFAAANKNLAVTWILDLNTNMGGTNAPKSKYVFVEGKILGGMGQAGVISPIVESKMANGFYGNSTFFDLTGVKMDNAGVCYMTGPWTVAYTGAASILGDTFNANTGKLGVAMDVKDINGKVAIIMEQQQSIGKYGYDLYVDAKDTFGALTVAGQVIWGITDQGRTQKKNFAVYLNYALDKTQAVYLDYTGNDNGANACSQYNAGYTLAVNSDTTAIVNYAQNLLSNVDNFTVGLNFNI